MVCQIHQEFNETLHKSHNFIEEKCQSQIFSNCNHCVCDDQEFSISTMKKSRLRRFFEFFQTNCLLEKSDNLTNYSQHCCKINSEISIKSKVNNSTYIDEYCDLHTICTECYQQFYSPYSYKPRRLFRLYPIPTRFHLKSKRFAKTSRSIFR